MKPQQQQQVQQPKQQPQQQAELKVNEIIEQKPIPVIGAGINIQHNIAGQNSLETNGNYSMDEDMNKKAMFRKFLGSRKKASVRAKERRLRQNKRLRKVLVPKNALMALHELRGVMISDFNVSNKTGGGFICQVTVNNIQYEGFGASKMAAKSDASEKALRDLFISKMLQRPLKNTDKTDGSIENISKPTEIKPLETTEGDVEMKSAENSDEDDIPMVNLASYALYKLFSEWENEGFEIPEFRSSSSLSNSTASLAHIDVKKPPTVRTELPPKWQDIHPAMLLCMMRPGSSYTDLGSEGVAPNQIQRIGIVVDGENFIGKGRSKKLLVRMLLLMHVINSLEQILPKINKVNEIINK